MLTEEPALAHYAKDKDNELKLHTDGEMPTGDNKNNYVETEILPVRRLTENACNRIDTGVCDIPKTSGCEKKKNPCLFQDQTEVV